MKTEDLHDEMCAALESIGGIPPEHIRADADGSRKCDIVFLNRNVLVEVKTLTSDRGTIQSVKEKNGRLLHKWAVRGRAPIAFGTVNIKLAELEKPVAEDILMNVGQRVRDDLTSADKQISATKRHLGLDDVHGLIIFVVPAHFRTNNGLIYTVATRHLERRPCAAIDTVMIIPAIVEEGFGAAFPRELAMTHHAANAEKRLDEDFAFTIMRGWGRHFSQREGIPTLPMRRVPAEDFERRFLTPEP